MSWSPKLFSPLPFVCAPHSPLLLQRLPSLPHEGRVTSCVRPACGCVLPSASAGYEYTSYQGERWRRALTDWGRCLCQLRCPRLLRRCPCCPGKQSPRGTRQCPGQQPRLG